MIISTHICKCYLHEKVKEIVKNEWNSVLIIRDDERDVDGDVGGELSITKLDLICCLHNYLQGNRCRFPSPFPPKCYIINSRTPLRDHTSLFQSALSKQYGT